MKTYICQLIKSSKKFIEKSYKILKTIVSITEHNMQYSEILLWKYSPFSINFSLFSWVSDNRTSGSSCFTSSTRRFWRNLKHKMKPTTIFKVWGLPRIFFREWNVTWAEHWDERLVNPTMSANRILKWWRGRKQWF